MIRWRSSSRMRCRRRRGSCGPWKRRLTQATASALPFSTTPRRWRTSKQCSRAGTTATQPSRPSFSKPSASTAPGSPDCRSPCGTRAAGLARSQPANPSTARPPFRSSPPTRNRSTGFSSAACTFSSPGLTKSSSTCAQSFRDSAETSNAAAVPTNPTNPPNRSRSCSWGTSTSTRRRRSLTRLAWKTGGTGSYAEPGSSRCSRAGSQPTCGPRCKPPCTTTTSSCSRRTHKRKEARLELMELTNTPGVEESHCHRGLRWRGCSTGPRLCKTRCTTFTSMSSKSPRCAGAAGASRRRKPGSGLDPLQTRMRRPFQ
mmetsp:Transcript_4748/g.16377  ORF Transcript_4748/g.16377 Transcript_4748/m.16377 type:complete len:315 (-) Transcript_4748:793-1737(-)